MNKYTGLTEKYLLGQKKRSIFTILGIILSVTLLTSIGTLGVSYHDKMIRQTIQEYGDYDVSFNGVTGEAVPQIVNQAVIGSSGVLHREGYAAISPTSEKEKQENPFSAPYRYLNVKAYDKGAMEKLQIQLEAGRLPQNKNEIVLSSWSLQYLPSKTAIGDTLKLDLGERLVASTGAVKSAYSIGDFGWDLDEKFVPNRQQEYTIVGIMQPSATATWSASFIYPAITYDDHQKTDKAKTYFVYTSMKSRDNMEKKTEAIISSLAVRPYVSGKAQALDRETTIKDVRVDYNDSLLKLYGKSTYSGVNQSMIYAFAAIVLIIMGCTSAVIYNTFHISILERITQFGMLRCIGATPKQIRKVVLKEATLLSLIAIPLGLLTGTVLMKLLFYNIGLLALGSLNDMHMIISLPVLAAATALGLATVYLSAIGPARMASRISPLEAMKGSGATVVTDNGQVRRSGIAGRLFGFEGTFASRNIRRNKKKFRITAFSMIVSMILFIVFQGLVGYLRTTSASGIDYSYSLQYERASEGIPDSVFAHIQQLDAVDQAYPFYNHQIIASIPKSKLNPPFYKEWKGIYTANKGEAFETDNNFLVSYGVNGLEALRKKLTSGHVDSKQMDAENGVIVIQKISMITEAGKRTIIDQTRFQIGDKIQVRAVDGVSHKTLTVMGTADQSPLSEAYGESAILTFITTPKVVADITGNPSYNRMFIQAKPNSDHKPIVDYVKSLVQKDAAFNYNDRVKQLEQDKNDAITINIFLYGFIGVIVSIAFLNILNTVSTNLILRSKEFAVLKAIGMTQRGIQKMVIMEGIFYGTFAAIYGSILGAGLSYGISYLMRGVIQMDWVIPWFTLAIASIGAIAATILATLIPLKQLNRIVIVEGLRNEG
jgi:putative ABC transport system permease protein